MANNINLQQAEYDTILSKLVQLHKEELQIIREIAKDIQELSEKEGGFYVELISLKIHNLLTMLEESATGKLENAFSVSEEGIEKYIQIIKNVDTCC